MNIILFQDITKDTTILAVNGKEVSAMKVFALSLKFFREHALQELNDQSTVTLKNEDIRWVITVPAIWRESAKQFMRQAAYQVREIGQFLMSSMRWIKQNMVFGSTKCITLAWLKPSQCNFCRCVISGRMLHMYLGTPMQVVFLSRESPSQYRLRTP